MPEQFKVSIPKNLRVDGWLYDVDSGLVLGLGSYEQIEQYGYNTVFNYYAFGGKYKATIYHA
jgi:hypothetical protein